jgi:hypothetical protein
MIIASILISPLKKKQEGLTVSSAKLEHNCNEAVMVHEKRSSIPLYINEVKGYVQRDEGHTIPGFIQRIYLTFLTVI